MKIGSHVSMSGKDMLLGSAKEAVSYGADTFMFYTGAPQNTRRKDISELNIDAAWEYMNAHGIDGIIVHAPYIINLGNTVKPETFSLAVEFLAKEIERTISCRSHTLILHPGAHVGAGTEAGTAQIIKGLNEFPLISISAVQSTEVRRRDAERHTLICAYNKYRYHSSHIPRVFHANLIFYSVGCVSRKGSVASLVPSFYPSRRRAAQGFHCETFGLSNVRDECE